MLQQSRGASASSLTAEIIGSALESELPDFEDNIQLFSAINAGVEHLVTRNVVHFQQEMVEVVTPLEFLSILANAGNSHH